MKKVVFLALSMFLVAVVVPAQSSVSSVETKCRAEAKKVGVTVPSNYEVIEAGYGTTYGTSKGELICVTRYGSKIKAGFGNDIIVGSTYGDVLDGGFGNDTIIGGIGDDTITAGYGADTVWAGPNNDTVDGGPGYDTIYPGGGTDDITE